MRTTLRLLSAGLMAAVVLSSGCAVSKNIDAAKQVRSKNPHASIEFLARVLKDDPSNGEAIALTDEIGKEIASAADAKIRDFEASKKYAQAVAVADRVLATRDFVAKGPSQVDLFVDEEQRPRLAALAAAQFYKTGDNIASAKPVSPKSAMKAAVAFRRSLGFVPGFKDSQKRYEETRELAMTRVRFGKFNCKSGTDFLVDNFKSELKGIVGDLGPEFLEISGPKNSNAVLTADIEGGFRDSGWKSKRQKNTVTKSREVGMDDQGNTLYEEYDVTATWVRYTRKTNATISLRYMIKDSQGTQLSTGNGRMKMSDMKEYVSDFGGDTSLDDYEDAIPSDVSSMPKNRDEPANAQQLMERMSEKWGKKGEPIYKFGHKIFSKFSAK
ncbi:MAG: hypothetical protein JKY65_07345 [Planctomycetes bacterium]|nr:hypothetical protein [Planctomycetota bacterium]